MWWFWKRKKTSEPSPVVPPPAETAEAPPAAEDASARARPGMAAPPTNIYHTPNQRPVPRRRPSKRR